MGLGNIDWTIRSNPLILPAIVVVLPPILLGCPFEGHGKTTTVKEQQIHYQEVLRKVFEHIFLPPNPLFNAGKLTLSADGQMRQCFPVICAWMADYFENIHLDPFKQPHCPVWEAPQSSFGQGNSLSWQLRDCELYFQTIILATQWDVTERLEEEQYLQDWGVQTSEVVFWTMKSTSLTTIMVPDILHTLLLGMRKQLIDWVLSCLKQHSRIDTFEQCRAIIPPYLGFARFHKPYSHVPQCSGNEMKAHGSVIVPVFPATPVIPLASQRIPFT